MHYLLGALFALGLISSAKADEYSYKEMQIQCLRRAIYEEARSESVSVQIKIGQILLANADDTEGRLSLCRVIFKKGYLSWAADERLFRMPKESGPLTLAGMIARDLYTNRPSLPKGWECVRNFERTDFKGASKKGRSWFEKNEIAVEVFGHFTAYRSKGRCTLRLREV